MTSEGQANGRPLSVDNPAAGRYQSIFMNTLDGILLADDQGRFVEVNPAACRMTGYDRDELLSLAVWDITPNPNIEDSRRLWRNFITDGVQSGEYDIRRKDGTRVTAEYRAVSNIAPGLHVSVLRDVTARKAAENRLMDQQSLLAAAVNLAKIGSWEYSLESGRVRISEQFRKIHGLTDSEAPFEQLQDICHPEDRSRVLALLQDAVTRSAVYDLEHRIVHPITGETRYVHAFGQVVRDERDMPVKIVGASQDITDMKTREQDLLDSRERLRLALENAEQGMWEIRPAEGAVKFDDIALRLLGAQKGEETTKLAYWVDRVHPRDLAALRDSLARYVQNTGGRYTREFRLMDQDGAWKWFAAEGKATQFDESGKPILIMGVLREITQRKSAEEALRKREAHSRALLAAVPEMIFEFDQNARYLDFKPSPETKPYVAPEQFLGQSVRDVLPKEPADRIYQTIQRVIDQGGVEFLEFDLVEGGQKRYYEARLVKSDSERALATVLDVTARKLAEKEHSESEQRYRVVTEYVADGVAVFQDGEMVFHNRALKQWFGPASEGGLVLPAELTERIQKCRLKQPFEESYQEVFQRKCRIHDEQEKWFEVHCTTIVWEGLPAFMATFRDITEAKIKELAIQTEAEWLRRENIQLRSVMPDRYRLGPIVGKTEAMQELYELIIKAAHSEANVIITGESGTGKELAAQTIFKLSDSYHQSFVPVNCGAIPESLFESELFGHKKGAFTGADFDKYGYIKLANEGTLFLDEVTELSLNLQVKLLRVLEAGFYTPLGAVEQERSRFRIISASNRALKPLVEAGALREDFYYRIHVIPLHIPPLRERRADIPLLIEHLLGTRDASTEISDLPGSVLEALYNHDWPGNVRELKNALDRYLTLGRLDLEPPASPGPMPTAKPEAPGGAPLADQGLGDALAAYERRLILEALERAKWRRGEAADILGISRRSLFRRMQNLGIK